MIPELNDTLYTYKDLRKPKSPPVSTTSTIAKTNIEAQKEKPHRTWAQTGLQACSFSAIMKSIGFLLAGLIITIYRNKMNQPPSPTFSPIVFRRTSSDMHSRSRNIDSPPSGGIEVTKLIPSYPPQPCNLGIEAIEIFEKEVHDLLKHGGGRVRKVETGTSSENYVIEGPEIDGKREIIAAFKPNKGHISSKQPLFTNTTPELEVHFTGLYSRDENKKQELALELINHGHESCTPIGLETEITSTAFNNDGRETTELGWLSKWGQHLQSPSLAEIEEIFKSSELEKIRMIDFILGNPDHVPSGWLINNILFYRDERKWMHLRPIDWDFSLVSLEMGKTFPVFIPKMLHPNNFAYIHSLNADDLQKRMIQKGFPREVAFSVKMRLLLIQHTVKLSKEGLASGGIKNFLDPAPYESLLRQAKKEAKKRLSPEDVAAFTKGEKILFKRFKKEEVSPEDLAWYQNYEKESQSRIYQLIEAYTEEGFLEKLNNYDYPGENDVLPLGASLQEDQVIFF